MLLTSFASANLQLSLNELARTARQHGIRRLRLWDPVAIRRSSLYRRHHDVLGRARGAGYWLWKPYIISSALRHSRHGDVIVYADAGISISRPLAPLAELCRARGGILLFRGHYDGVRGRPNTCGTWTKRDCLQALGCDAPQYYDAPMVDASLMVVAKGQRAMRFVREWLHYCRVPQWLTDEPSAAPELPSFVEHRHDQSILSLLACREGLEIFRSPSQFGNHGKAEPWREPGEWLRAPYGSQGVYENSPYPTLVFHHRKRTLVPADAAPSSYRLAASGGKNGVGTSTASDLEVIHGWWRQVQGPRRVLQIGACGATVAELRRRWHGLHWSDMDSGLRRVRGRGGHNPAQRFNVIVSASRHGLVSEVESLKSAGLLDESGYVICWTHLVGIEGWAAFQELRKHRDAVFPTATTLSFGLARQHGRTTATTLGAATVLRRR